MDLGRFLGVSRRRLAVGVACSLVLHLTLVALAIWAKSWAPAVVVKKGEPIFVDLPPVNPEEPPPPRPAPARPPGPIVAAKPKPAVSSAEPPKVRPAPQSDTPRPAPAPPPQVAEPARPPEPSVVAKAAPHQEPEAIPSAPTGNEPESTSEAPSPATPGSEPEKGAHKETEESMVAVARPKSEPGASSSITPGEGGGLRRGRGVIEGEPIPLDTPDPRYSDYMDKIRQRIKSTWIYPREAGDRGIGGQLVIHFAIAKDGKLEAIELEHSSGVPILDLYALNAIKLAQPFPPVPDSVSKAALPIMGIFMYIVNTGLLNQYLR